MMREWFHAGDLLRKEDCRILNRAVRNVFVPPRKPSFRDLTWFRSAYRPGMSAQDLIDKFNSTPD